MKTEIGYLSVIDKWLHYDKSFTHETVRKVIGVDDGKEYLKYLRRPWEYFTIIQMEKIAFLLDKDLTEVFWACFKRPYSEVAYDEKRLKLIQALEKAGIK
jgi:hypothetical protein